MHISSNEFLTQSQLAIDEVTHKLILNSLILSMYNKPGWELAPKYQGLAKTNVTA